MNVTTNDNEAIERMFNALERVQIDPGFDDLDTSVQSDVQAALEYASGAHDPENYPPEDGYEVDAAGTFVG